MEIYTKNNCPACDATKQFLDNNNVKYVEKNIEEDEKHREVLMESGISSVPVIFLENGDSILGFNILELQKLTK